MKKLIATALKDGLVILAYFIVGMILAKPYLYLAGSIAPTYGALNFFSILLLPVACAVSVLLFVWWKEERRVKGGLWLGHSIRWVFPLWFVILFLPIITNGLSLVARALDFVLVGDFLHEIRYLSPVIFFILTIVAKTCLALHTKEPTRNSCPNCDEYNL